ncbi:hypothetical protein COV12_01335 [Candidatus Woesearchaeota archaeon CG10_big_fil_rev_8_21_14_0_10_32_24]|nr:MAG: hypothetical protein COV12_01335 [Candidatus Woesearchaeota archaeon CG10_big_fil_rev_8_21_14_0_10_32_24]
MAKKTKKTMKKTSKPTSKPTSLKSVDTTTELSNPNRPKLPPEMEQKLKDLKDKLDKFKDKVLEKFADYIVGITLLPPEDPKTFEKREQEFKDIEKQTGKKQNMPSKDDINLLVIVDDTTSKKMTKDELHQKFSTIITKIGEEVDKNIKPQSILLTDLWQNCYDAKYDLNKLISIGAPIHDTGMLAAIKISEIHKTMVLKKFEKYILSYVLAGSLTQGRATPTSDIDVWIVIDDTDVKKMTRLELKDKLRAIIIGMGMEAGEMTGIKNKLNIQVYILTDFWDSLKEANPIIFTLLRDGVPFYDRGIFMPWKQLLRMGRIKPSREAIDLFMNTGEQSLKRIKGKLKEMGMEDTYYAILTPSQAAIMMYGLPPPTPRETPEVLEKIFVKQEKMLEQEYVNILKRNVQIRKEIEHGTMKELSGKELDTLVINAEKFLKRIDELFKQIEQMHNEKSINLLYDEVVTLTRDVLKLEGIKKIQEFKILEHFEEELVTTGKIPARFTHDIKEVFDAKKKFDLKKLDKTDIENARKSATVMIKFLIEYIQRKRGQEMERAKIRVKYGEKFGEIILLDTIAFIMYNIDGKDQQIEKADIQTDGGLGPLQKSDFKELEKALMEKKFSKRVFIKDAIFEDLKNIFGRDVEVLLHY